MRKCQTHCGFERRTRSAPYRNGVARCGIAQRTQTPKSERSNAKDLVMPQFIAIALVQGAQWDRFRKIAIETSKGSSILAHRCLQRMCSKGFSTSLFQNILRSSHKMNPNKNNTSFRNINDFVERILLMICVVSMRNSENNNFEVMLPNYYNFYLKTKPMHIGFFSKVA